MKYGILFLLGTTILLLSLWYVLSQGLFIPHGSPAISKDTHHWYAKPVEVTDYNLGHDLFGLPTGYFRAWYVGDYISSTNILGGSKIVIAVFRDFRPNVPVGTGACDTLAQLFIIKPALTPFVYFDAKYSPENIVLRGYGPQNQIQKGTGGTNPIQFQQLDIAYMPSLEFPGFIKHNSHVYAREIRPYSCFVINANNETEFFFDDIKETLTPLYWDSVLGQAYLDSVKHDIVFRMPDGLVARYELKQ